MAEPDVVDPAVLDELAETTGRDPVFLAELIDTYLDDSVALLASLRRAVAEPNAAELRRAAHSLKSNSEGFGARRLASLCREFEQRVRDGILDGAAERLARIESAYAEVERELRALRPGR